MRHPLVQMHAETGRKLLYFDQGKTAVSRLLAVYDKGLPALDGLLEARISAMQTRLLWLVLGITVSILLAIYFFFSFFFQDRISVGDYW